MPCVLSIVELVAGFVELLPPVFNVCVIAQAHHSLLHLASFFLKQCIENKLFRLRFHRTKRGRWKSFGNCAACERPDEIVAAPKVCITPE